MNCRHCKAKIVLRMVDLGNHPFSNAYLSEKSLHLPEKSAPLQVRVCEQCWLVQTRDFVKPQELFTPSYAYFSSYSASWLRHCERFVFDAAARFDLGANSYVVEVAANDGYLLQYIKALGVPCMGVEPTASTARAARAKGILIVEDFFSTSLAKKLVAQGQQSDLIVAINVLAHVSDINDFVGGFTVLLKPNGVCAFEFPHLMQLVEHNQFDTIYHEHFSYFSLSAVVNILKSNNLTIFGVEEVPTHGGSLRVFAQRSDTGEHPRNISVDLLLQREKEAGVLTPTYYTSFQGKAEKIKNDFLAFLLKAQREGKTVAAYGAAAKGNTLMNYAEVGSSLVCFVADRNPAKQGMYMPGSHIPIVAEPYIREAKPDYVLILPWNLNAEVTCQLAYIRGWGGQFVTAVPELQITS